MPGWVYVLGNSSMPGMVKIGRTRGNPEDRARALSAATGVPTPFKVLNALACRDEVAVEKAVHHHLARWRVSGRREFFAISPSQAAKALHSFSDRPGMSGNILLILCLSLLVAVIAVAVVVGWPGSPGEQSRAVTSAAVACAAFWLFSRKRRPTSRLPVSRRRR